MDLEFEIGPMTEQEIDILHEFMKLKSFRKWLMSFDKRLTDIFTGQFDPLQAKVYAKVLTGLAGLILKAVKEVEK